MILWSCDRCGCELRQEAQPQECPLCMHRDAKFSKYETEEKREDDDIVKKYEEVVDKLEEYTEDCEPENKKFSFAD